MIASEKFPPPGTEVGCEYRWPYDHAHPDCWQPPHKGVILALDDPRAWKDTIAFPNRLPEQAEVTKHVEWCLSQQLLQGSVPVLYISSLDGEELKFVQWDSKLRPYAEELAAWEAARQAKREDTRLRGITTSNGRCR